MFEFLKTKANIHFYEAIVWCRAPAATTAEAAKATGTGIRYAEEG